MVHHCKLYSKTMIPTCLKITVLLHVQLIKPDLTNSVTNRDDFVTVLLRHVCWDSAVRYLL